MAHAVSPLAPKTQPDMPAVGGVRIAAGLTGMRYKNRDDIVFFAFDPGTSVAGVFTTNKMPGMPVDWCRKYVAKGRAQGLVVNAGNANVFTGKVGRAACAATARAAARALACKPEAVMLASTGVIGLIPDGAKLAAAVDDLAGRLGTCDWARAARAIMTTDTFPKMATVAVKIGGKTVRVNGICKGSGMIAPDMATMLAFVATDAAVAPAALRGLVKSETRTSFNAVTVDGDTSTSDTLLAFATGAAGNKPVAALTGADGKALRKAFAAVLRDLAIQVARDGEGAQKLVTIDVTGAVSDESARKVAMSIGNSPLVKTALAAGDANWGRIVAAVGKAGEKADRDRLAVSIGGVPIARKGGLVPGYDEAPVAAHLKGREVGLAVDLGLGKGKARVWTCDLTHAYIDINADYRS
ncbi:MAG: bifunctional glutamate N-acetyltransferase/amino-acid acetyltransferase ArgJ [Tagaea sp.]